MKQHRKARQPGSRAVTAVLWTTAACVVTVWLVLLAGPGPAAQTLLDLQPPALSQPLAGPAPTPLAAAGEQVSVGVLSVDRNGVNAVYHGRVANRTSAPVAVPVSGWVFTDAAGQTYSSPVESTTTLSPGEETTWDIGVPIAANQALTLTVSIPPEPPHTFALPPTP